eukprot:Phypoly_transcript_06890.p1 GENE.Phypoly_transcript_06890~~Phypoly_transcript_06890.p1  ORF type:complete len:387 (+),score=16.02 Phypoly_transcript_06890:310-1470(+)
MLFTGSLDSTQLESLLTTELRVNFFDEQVRTTLDRYSLLLVESALLKFPNMSGSEVLWSSFWDNFLADWIVAIRYFLHDSLLVRRNVVDTSISQSTKRRDFLLESYNVVLSAGEDKSAINNIETAVTELSSKHLGNTRATYGDLDHILAFATANETIQFFRMSLATESPAQRISPCYHVTTDRVKVIKAFVNLIRWARTAKTLVCKGHPLYKKESRVSPYGDEFQLTTIEFHHKYVEKIFVVPAAALSNFTKVYSGVKALNGQNCQQLKVSSLAVWSDSNSGYDERWHISSNKFIPPHLQNKDVQIKIQTYPIGASLEPRNAKESRDRLYDVLVFLKAFHSQGLVHRDLRGPNVLLDENKRWFVIDYEMAGEKDAYEICVLIILFK